MRARIALFLTLVFLTACAVGAPATSQATQPPAPSATPIPTPGPTSTPPTPLVILVVPPTLSEEQSKAYQKTVYDLSQAQGYRFVVFNKITQADLEPGLKLVINLSPETEIVALAAAAPQAQFLAVNMPEIKPAGNISVLGGTATSIDKVAFMAGYIGAMITQDFRTGALLRKGSPDEETIMNAMRAGQQFFCGLCNPYTGPFEKYPLMQNIPDDAKPAEYGAYADLLIRKQVNTLFFEPGVDLPELLEYLQTVGMLMIGTQTPSQPVSGWVVTLQPNYLEALRAAFPELIAGQGGKAFPAPLSFNDANPGLFGLGKQTNARQVLSDLLAGLISTAIQ